MNKLLNIIRCLLRKPISFFCVNAVLASTLILSTSIISTSLEAQAKKEKEDASLTSVLKAKNRKSCQKALDEFLDTECGKLSLGILDKASFKFGLALNAFTVFLEDEEGSIAKFGGDFNPAPYYSISFKSNYFGSTSLGYEFAFIYNTSFTTKQVLQVPSDTNSSETRLNLGSYISATMITINPTLFYGIGTRDETPDIFMKIGFGVGAGYVDVSGYFYETDTVEESNPDCHIAVLSKEIPEIRNNCHLSQLAQQGIGGTSRLFLETQYNNFLFSLDTTSIIIGKEDFTITPQQFALLFAYVLNL